MSAAVAARLLRTGLAVGQKGGCRWTIWVDGIDKDVLILYSELKRSAMRCV